jgi:hypothetical protein
MRCGRFVRARAIAARANGIVEFFQHRCASVVTMSDRFFEKPILPFALHSQRRTQPELGCPIPYSHLRCIKQSID